MNKIEKKIARINDKIRQLESEMYTNIKQKVSNTSEISISDYQNKINILRKQLQDLK